MAKHLSSEQDATQVRHPWRATIRTWFAAIIAFAAMYPAIIAAAGLPDTAWVAVSVAVAGAITRIMALPAVNDFITRFLPWLAPDKPVTPTLDTPAGVDSDSVGVL